MEMEQAYDTFKNILNADHVYIRDDNAMLGWMFVNFTAQLIFIYRK